MARVESMKKKMRRLIVTIVILSVSLIFLFQMLLNKVEFSSLGQSIYPDFWNQPHHLFTAASITINLCIPLSVIYILTKIFYKRYVLQNIEHLSKMIQEIKSNDINNTTQLTNISEFNNVITEIDFIKQFLKENIENQLTIQNNFKKKLEIFEHDLKTPLTVLQGHADLLKKINNSELPQTVIHSKINKEANIIMNSVERINHQIKIYIANINLLPSKSENISICDTISTINENYNNEQILRNKSLNIQTDQHVLKPHILISNQILYHVIDNLINNALKYSKNEINICFKMPHSDTLYFSITNDGKTFSKEELNFAKEWGVKGKQSNGSGIGLYFANEVVKQYGGELMLENEANYAKVSFSIKI